MNLTLLFLHAFSLGPNNGVFGKRRYHAKNVSSLLQATVLARNVPCGTLYKCPRYYCLPWHLVCDGFWDCPKGAEESRCLHRNCHGMYACPDSSICIHLSGICDSIIECPGYNDEVFCDLPPCPEGCECLACMAITNTTTMTFSSVTDRFIFSKI